MNTSIKQMKEIILKLNKASEAYYKYDSPVMSDKEYDDLYDTLTRLEKITGITMAASPTQKVQGYVLDGFKKVTHSKPMLSAAKTKNVDEIKKFIGTNDYYASYKLDGLTTCLRYENGEFRQGLTRGNGIVGEDVTEVCKFISNVPMKIPYKEPLEIRGETVISWEEFKRINSSLDEPYSHPRNLAAGTLRNLDLNVAKDRKLSFVAFECVSDMGLDSKYSCLKLLDEIGFETVGRTKPMLRDDINWCIETLKPNYYDYPVDGIIFELDNIKISKSLGATEHHENCRIALKWADELYETTLKDVIWQTSKTGLINPVAVFEPVDLDGAITTRATLHNISYIEDLELGIGDTIQVYRANMVIPKVHDNLTRSNTLVLPKKCPCCGGKVEVQDSGNSKSLVCTNPDCSAKLLGKLVHFVSRDAINIDGLSEATLQLLLNRGWVKSFKDLYNLSDDIIEAWKHYTPGFGEKSVNKILQAIADSRTVSLANFIYSLSVPYVGKTVSRALEVYCRTFDAFISDCLDNKDWSELEGVGNEINISLQNYFKEHREEIIELAKEFTFVESNSNRIKSNSVISGKTFVVTGSVEHFKNRNELKEKIETMGGKVASAVSTKTDYLINNDITSNSSKNQKAKTLNIPIITEEDFLQLLGDE